MSKAVQFTKMHGCGNDYIYVNASRYPLPNPAEVSVQWSAPHTGIGADGLVLVGESTKDADFSMRIFNADGTEAMMCGNACRCVGKFVYENGFTRQTVLQLETLSGVRELRLTVNERSGTVTCVAVNMGEPVIGRTTVPLCVPSAAGVVYTGTEISMGNPHLVIFVDDIATAPLEAIGRELEFLPGLSFGRTNVEFAQVLDRRHIRMRVWERGSGITQACGTGASAVVVAAALLGRCDRHALVAMDGGVLSVEWEELTNSVFTMGDAVTVFQGTVELPAPAESAGGREKQ